jgi:putative ABC transport system permease protein
MDEPYISLSLSQVAAATALLLLNGVVSVALRLGLEWQILVAGVRTVLQLVLVGMILHSVFSAAQWPLVLALIFIMTMIAGISAVKRTQCRYAGIWWNGIVAMSVSAWAIGGITLGFVIRNDPWYSPQYAIPLLGMILGNTLSGISLGIDRFTSEIAARRDEVECLLTLGATRWEATLPIVRDAVRTGMLPIINSMMVVGIVSIPGMMTGQILAGQQPAEAVKYQIVIMFVIASATALGTVLAVLLAQQQLVCAMHRLRIDELISTVK